MRWLIRLLAIIALAVGLTLALRYEAGYVLVVLPSYRAELSLNLMILLLVAGFAATYLLVRVVSHALTLPAQVRRYRERRRHEKAQEALLAALREFFEARYGRAEKAAARSIELGGYAGLSAVLAARAAHELRAYDRRDAYLAQAEALEPDGAILKRITEAELLLDERRFQDALDVLRSLPEKHTAALRHELRAQQHARNWEQVLSLIAQLHKRGVFDATQAEQLRRHALAENLRRKALDLHALEGTWQKITARERKDTKIAAAAAQCFIALGGCERAQQIIEASLDEQWDSELVSFYAECRGQSTVRQIERAEAWLKAQPQDAALLLVLGRLCAHQELWGKAQSYLEAGIAIEPTYSGLFALAQLQEKLGNADAAHRHFRESLELAVGQLRQLTGGRRKTPL